MKATKILNNKTLIFIDKVIRKIGYHLAIIKDTKTDNVLKFQIKRL